ncbi:MAG: glycosyltransferase [Magnetococcus sp. DMHC-6]
MNPGVSPVSTQYIGHLDGVHGSVIFGWVIDRWNLQRRLSVEIIANDQVIAQGSANRSHKFLVEKKIGDGRYGFKILLPDLLKENQRIILRARVPESDFWLTGEQLWQAQPPLRGHIEGISAGMVFGWLEGIPTEKGAHLEVQLDGDAVGLATIDKQCDVPGVTSSNQQKILRFFFDLTPYLKDGFAQTLTLIETTSGQCLPGTPLNLQQNLVWGCVDHVNGFEFIGWIVHLDPKVIHCGVELWVDGFCATTTLAQKSRLDLFAMGLKRVRCGFSLVVPPRFYDGHYRKISIRSQESGTELRNGGREWQAQIRYMIEHVDQNQLSGWLFDICAPNKIITLDLWEADRVIASTEASGQRPDVGKVLNLPSTLACGFSFALPPDPSPWLERRLSLCPQGMRESIIGKDILLLQRHETIRQAELLARESGLVGYFIPDWIAQWRADEIRSPIQFREVASVIPSEERVDIIIPVYKGYDETLACVQSVLNCRETHPFELIVLNDASPDSLLCEALQRLASSHGFTWIENVKNIGFVATVNRGMRLHSGRDVILLNADTVVPPSDWITRLRQAAYRQPKTATVTPFSNRATICSLPRNLYDNLMPSGETVATLDALCQESNKEIEIEIPTAVGFCMYIRRQALAEVGFFNEQRWGKGYGEENEFCILSAALGWRHVIATDLFVQHHGSVSFQGEKGQRVSENLNILNKLYPDYAPRIQNFIAADPLWQARGRVVLALMRGKATRFMLHVVHHWGGGIENHLRQLCHRLEQEGEATLILRPGAHGWIELTTLSEDLLLSYPKGFSFDVLVEDLQQLGIWHLHFHQTIGLPLTIWELPKRLGIGYDYTIHDYFFGCPRINLLNVRQRYCGIPNLEECEFCIQSEPLPKEIAPLFTQIGETVEAWRTFYQAQFAQARRLFAPSQDALQHFQRFFDVPQMVYQPHPERPFTKILPPPLLIGGELRVAVIGAIGIHKGHAILWQMARLAFEKKLALRFIIIGYTCDNKAYASLPNVDILGPYKPEDLPTLLEASECSLALFLSRWPETYSYTLTEALRSGLIPVVPDLGALAERLKHLQCGYLFPLEITPGDLLKRLQQIVTEGQNKIPVQIEYLGLQENLCKSYYAFENGYHLGYRTNNKKLF